MRNCTDFWINSLHDEVLIPSELHYNAHTEASETSSISAEDYSLSKHGLPILGEGSRALRTAARNLMLLGAGVENGDDSCVLIKPACGGAATRQTNARCVQVMIPRWVMGRCGRNGRCRNTKCERPGSCRPACACHSRPLSHARAAGADWCSTFWARVVSRRSRRTARADRTKKRRHPLSVARACPVA